MTSFITRLQNKHYCNRHHWPFLGAFALTRTKLVGHVGQHTDGACVRGFDFHGDLGGLSRFYPHCLVPVFTRKFACTRCGVKSWMFGLREHGCWCHWNSIKSASETDFLCWQRLSNLLSFLVSNLPFFLPSFRSSVSFFLPLLVS